MQSQRNASACTAANVMRFVREGCNVRHSRLANPQFAPYMAGARSNPLQPPTRAAPTHYMFHARTQQLVIETWRAAWISCLLGRTGSLALACRAGLRPAAAVATILTKLTSFNRPRAPEQGSCKRLPCQAPVNLRIGLLGAGPPQVCSEVIHHRALPWNHISMCSHTGGVEGVSD